MTMSCRAFIRLGAIHLAGMVACGLDARGTGSAGGVDPNGNDPNAPSNVVDAGGAGARDSGAASDGSVTGGPVTSDDAGDEATAPKAIAHLDTVTGTSSDSASTTIGGPAAGGPGTYLVAVSSKPHRVVTSVSGLGLTWTQLDSQCGEDDQTGVAVWGAIGTAMAGGSVTATLDSAPLNTVIALSRFSGPTAFGTVRSANSHGEEAQAVCTDDGDGDPDVRIGVSPPAGGVVYGAIAIRLRAHAPNAGTVEIGEENEGSGGDVAGLALVTTTGTLVSGTLSSSTGWAGSAVTLLP